MKCLTRASAVVVAVCCRTLVVQQTKWLMISHWWAMHSCQLSTCLTQVLHSLPSVVTRHFHFTPAVFWLQFLHTGACGCQPSSFSCLQHFSVYWLGIIVTSFMSIHLCIVTWQRRWTYSICLTQLCIFDLISVSGKLGLDYFSTFCARWNGSFASEW